MLRAQAGHQRTVVDVPDGGPRLRRQLSSHLQAWWVCSGNLMGHEAGRRGKLLEHHEHSKKENRGSGQSVTNRLAGKSAKGPAHARQGRGAAWFQVQWPFSQTADLCEIVGGISSRGAGKKGGTRIYITVPAQRASQPTSSLGTANKRQRRARAHADMRPGWFGGCGFLRGG